MNLRRLKKAYKGAGALFVHAPSDGDIELLLGQRRYRPHAGYYSIPGGGLSRRDEGDLFRCAVRETSEEFCHDEDLFRLLGPSGPKTRKEEMKVVRIRLPWFQWETWVIPIATKPPREFWPRPNSEFVPGTVDWYRRDDLPSPLHPGLRYALWRLGDSIKGTSVPIPIVSSNAICEGDVTTKRDR